MNILKKHSTFFLLLGVFIAALFLRVYKLGVLPYGFHEDEVLSGYVGRFILETGKDIYGNRWPLLYFNKFGDYYIIAPMYLSGLATFVFGVTEFAVRFPTALIGALTVFPLYFFTERIFKNKYIALLSCVVLAIMPWHVVMSRARAEGVLGAALMLTGLVWVINGIKSNKTVYFVLGGILLLGSYFTYHPYRILVPIALIPLLLFVSKKRLSMSVSIVTLIILCTGITGYISSTEWGKGRFAQTSIFSTLSQVSIRNQELIYDEGTTPIPLVRFFHNKLIGYSREFLVQYSTYFTPTFLALRGTTTSYYYALPDQGLVFVVFYVALLLVILFHKRLNFKLKEDEPLFWYAVYLLLIAPIPSALTILDAPNVHRSVMMTVYLAPFIGYGVWMLFQFKIKKIPVLALVACAVLIYEGVVFTHQYGQHAALFQSLARNDGQKELVQYVLKERTKYKQVIMPVQATMPLYYLFFKNDFSNKYAGAFGFNVRIDKIDNVEFVDNGCPTELFTLKPVPKDVLFIETHTCNPNLDKYELLKLIYGKNRLIPWKILRERPSIIR